MFNFSFLKKEIEELQEKGPSVKSKGLDKTQISINSIQSTEIPCNGKLNIVIMDDDSFMVMSMKRDIMQLKKTIKSDEYDGVIAAVEEKYGPDVRDRVNEFSATYNPDNYNITTFTGTKCGFEMIKSIKETDCNIDFAIMDIVLGGIVIDENDMFVSVDGIDVTKEMLDKYGYHVNVLISTGCSMKDSKEEHKLNTIIGNRPNVNVYIKGLDANVRLGDILVLLSGAWIEERSK
jgi:hypothetical protein